MKQLILKGKQGLLIAFGTALFGMGCSNQPEEKLTQNEESNTQTMKFQDIAVNDLYGKTFDLKSTLGKKVLVVNIASECGLTPQLGSLQELYEAYGGDKFEIIAFPSNDFGGQEPLEGDSIASFCSKNYGVTFPIMEKTPVTGENQHAVYAWLTSKAKNGVADHEVKWNFHKFLIDEQGNLVRDIDPRALPTDSVITAWIEE
jgi:glutathione peroxidase